MTARALQAGGDRVARAEIKHALELLFRPGDVVELRAFEDNKFKRTFSGYFDDFDALTSSGLSLNGTLPAIYVTLNPVKPPLLARAANRLVASPKATTSDLDIARRSNLLVDFDPVRPSGISSSDNEHCAAIALAERIATELGRDFGWPAPTLADSGNGAHLLYAIDLPNDTTPGNSSTVSFRFLTSVSAARASVSTSKSGTRHALPSSTGPGL